MRILMNVITTILAASVMIVVTESTHNHSDEYQQQYQYQYQYHPVVEQLQEYVESNVTFAHQLNVTFAERAKANNNSDQVINYQDMYMFFNTWLTIAPNASTGKVPSLTIYSFTGTAMGAQLTTYDSTNAWFRNWITAWTVYLDSANSTSVLTSWENAPGVNMTEYITPENGYPSFNAWIYREINMTYRPIASPENQSVVVSPVDGMVDVLIVNALDTVYDIFVVKGRSYNLSMILGGDESKVRLFENGTLVVVGLNLLNYHRYHSVCEGTVQQMDFFAGYYYYWPGNSSSAYAPDFDLGWSEHNRRGVLYIENAVLGLTAYMAVGSGELSSVRFSVEVNEQLSKGQEIGYFAYGGSTMLLLFQENAIQQSLVQENDTLATGQAMFLANAKSRTNK